MYRNKSSPIKTFFTFSFSFFKFESKEENPPPPRFPGALETSPEDAHHHRRTSMKSVLSCRGRADPQST